jgi:hypothetical protein
MSSSLVITEWTRGLRWGTVSLIIEAQRQALWIVTNHVAIDVTQTSGSRYDPRAVTRAPSHLVVSPGSIQRTLRSKFR